MAPIKKVTMQDIADACGLSRNTVSKIFNNRGSVPEATRDFVLSKAQELGYHQIGEPESAVQSAPAKNIALLTPSKPLNHSFGALFITNFTDRICRAGHNLKIFEISEEEYASGRLPSHFVLSDVSAIVGIELFDRDYTLMLCSLGIPVLLVDSYTGAPGELINCDLVYMENYASTIALTKRLIEAGAKRIGFVGDKDHCSSFRERWNGCRAALRDAGLELEPAVCILDDDSMPYGEVDWIKEKFAEMPYMPEAFVCANDFIAIRVIWALGQMGYKVPEDVMVTGFDGSPEAAVVSPSLTTAEIPSATIGRIAASVIISRISTPSEPNLCQFVRTIPVWRNSTR